MVHYFRQLCSDDAVLNIKSQPMEERDEQKGDRQPIQCAQVATERKHRWALLPPVAWVISVLCWLSVSLYIFESLSPQSQIIIYDYFHKRIFVEEESSIFHMSSEEQ